MSWIKLDDGFLDHPKFIEAGPLAAYLNICAIAWCNRNRTDGDIPRGQVPRLVNFEGFAHHCWMGEMVGGGDDAEPYALADELVAVGLWEPTDRGWRIHDYLDWQASREEIEAARTQRIEAGRRGGRKRAAKQMPSESLSESVSEPLSEMPSERSSKTQAKSNQEGRRKKEETPLAPQGDIPDVAPSKPTGNRQRDLNKFSEDMTAWAAHHFPGVDPRAVESTIVWSRLEEPVTADALRAAAMKNELWAAQLGLEAKGAA